MFIVISIHALRVEGDAYPGTKCVNKLYFYPRPPGGGRLGYCDMQDALKWRISIHALRVEGDGCDKCECAYICISIHALRVEGDSFHHVGIFIGFRISIHALRVEGDLRFTSKCV